MIAGARRTREGAPCPQRPLSYKILGATGANATASAWRCRCFHCFRTPTLPNSAPRGWKARTPRTPRYPPCRTPRLRSTRLMS